MFSKNIWVLPSTPQNAEIYVKQLELYRAIMSTNKDCAYPCIHSMDEMVVQESARTAWLCRSEEGRGCRYRQDRLPVVHRLSVRCFCKSRTECRYLPKPLAGCFPSSLQRFLLRDAPPTCPHISQNKYDTRRSSLSLSLSLINNETNSEEKTDRTCSMSACHITVLGEGGIFLWRDEIDCNL